MVEQTLTQGQHLSLVLTDRESRQIRFRQEFGSHLCLHIVHLSSEDPLHVEDLVEVEHLGEDCHTEIYALCLLCEHDEVSLHTRMLHSVGKGESKQVLKFVLADEAKGQFFGELHIAPDAQQVSAQQTNRNILLSPTAIMRTRPQLEIYADDVKASHGATTGQLDESSLFYMQQRCISPEEGRRLLLKAFINDVLESIEDEQQRASLMDAVDSII